MSIVSPDHGRAGKRRRRRYLGITCLAVTSLVLASCGGGSSDSSSGSSGSDSSSSGDTTDISVQLSWLPDSEFSPMFIADAEGIFEENGVSVEWIPGGPDIGTIEAIVGSGGADIGIATDITSVIAAQADGSPFVVLGALYPHNLNGFISPQDAPIDTPEKLAGAKIGASQGAQPKIEAILAANDLDPTDYTFVPAGFGPDLVINGDVDTQGVFITDEVIAYREETGEEPVLMKWDDIGMPSFTLTLFTTEDYLAENPEAVEAFLKSIQEGQELNEKDPELGPNTVIDMFGDDFSDFTLEGEIAKNAEYLKYSHSDESKENGYLWVDPGVVESEVVAAMELAGMKAGDVAEVINMTPLENIKSGS